MNMLVSGISVKDGKKIAYVMFDDNECKAEGIIPDCIITKNQGFTETEVIQLENYMKNNLSDIKKQAAAVNPIKAMLGE